MLALILVALGFVACNKSEETFPDNSIEGRYVGTLTNEGLKSVTGVMPVKTNATTDVTKSVDNRIEVHCYSDELDTTFMLDYYDNNDSVMVCLDGEAFKEMYGHMLGQGHMSGGMMGDLTMGETEWMHHLSDEHQPSDEHFGGFDMTNHTFGYRFQMQKDGVSYILGFQGSKTR